MEAGQNSVCLSACLDVNRRDTNRIPLHIETRSLAYPDLLINLISYQKLGQSDLLLPVIITGRKTGPE